jgi:uncharacterized protein YxeA
MADQANEQTGNGGKSNKAVVILLGIIIVLLIALIGVFAALLLKKEAPKEEPQEKRSVVVTKDNVEETVENMLAEEYTPPGYYEATMSTTWHFRTGDAISTDAYVANVKSNTNDVYFDVFIGDEEVNPIYQSPIIPLGGELDEIKLDTPLDAGTYDCLLVYHLVDDQQNTTSTLNMGVKIIVEE